MDIQPNPAQYGLGFSNVHIYDIAIQPNMGWLVNISIRPLPSLLFSIEKISTIISWLNSIEATFSIDQVNYPTKGIFTSHDK